MEPVNDLDKICESVFFGKSIINEKENKNPFADDDDSDTTENDSDDDSDSDTTSDSDDDSGSEETETESDSDDDSDDDSDSDAGEFGSSTTEDSDTANDETGSPFDGGSDSDDDTDDASTVSEDSSMGDLSDFGVELLMLSTQVHFWHINCEKNGDHNTLDALYNELNYDSDKLLEYVISKTKQSITAGSELSFDFGDLGFNKDECVGILEDVRDEANQIAGSHSDDQAVTGIIGDAVEHLSTAIYKLTRFDHSLD